MEKLAKYLSRNKMTSQDFAAMVNTTPATISRLLNRKSEPRIALAMTIEVATKGAVKARDWLPDTYLPDGIERRRKKTRKVA